jgi:gluconate 2-dehydrogenase gamma chain
LSAVDKSRRNFLAGTGQLAGTGWLAMNMPSLLAAGEAAQAQRSAQETWKNITDSEAATLTAVVDEIIPADDTPGASQAGVVYFIDNVLGGIMAESAAQVKQGVAGLEHNGFSGLTFQKQTAYLEKIEHTPFFSLMIFMTHCGMFAMPSWGGNRNLSGWKMLGFENLHAWQPPFGFYDAQALTGEQDDDHG